VVRSSKVSLKFCNTGKLVRVSEFLTEYARVMGLFVDALWPLDTIPALLPKAITSAVPTWLSARAVQACGKQASAVVRGTKRKQERAAFVIKKLNSEGRFKQARKLTAAYAKKLAGKPAISDVEAELDSRFVKIDLDGTNSFDGWLTLGCLGKGIKLTLPFKAHKHLRKMIANGVLKGGVRLSATGTTLLFAIPEPAVQRSGTTVGIDIGQKTTLSVSDGQTVDADAHGHTYQSICRKLARKQKGSAGFRQADTHRTNYLRWAVNRLQLKGVRCVNIEKIRGLRSGQRCNRVMQAWNYGQLFSVLKGKLQEAGVRVQEVNPTYTSQRCSKCGWTRKGNRKAKRFKCDKCGYAADADLNASINLSLELPAIGSGQRLAKISKIGFYWSAAGREPIVPFVQKAS
jgi:putative transposase